MSRNIFFGLNPKLFHRKWNDLQQKLDGNLLKKKSFQVKEFFFKWKMSLFWFEIKYEWAMKNSNFAEFSLTKNDLKTSQTGT